MKRQSYDVGVSSNEESSVKKLNQEFALSAHQEQMIHDVFAFINSKKHIVVILGAGVSVDAGFPDFRSSNGLFRLLKSKVPSQYSVDDVFDYETFVEDPALFYSTIRHFIPVEKPKPTAVHKWLRQMEPSLLHVITQNIDGLESELSCPITYIHGLLSSGVCLSCGETASEATMYSHYKKGSVARCQCGGVIKPNIVFYNEVISDDKIQLVQSLGGKCDLLLVMGTSLSTEPICNFIQYFNNCDSIIINQTALNVPSRTDARLTFQLIGSFRLVFKEQTTDVKESIGDDVSGKCICCLPVCFCYFLSHRMVFYRRRDL